MKAVIVDLDQTLLHTDKTLSEYTLAVLRRCRERGLALLVATARPERAITAYLQLIDFDAVITLNGARIVLEDRVIENGIEPGSVRSILAGLMANRDRTISIETSEGIYSNVAIPEWNSKVYEEFPDLPTRGRVFKILASDRKPVTNEEIESTLTEDVYYSVANRELIQIMSKKATKWSGILMALDFLRILPADAVYFGDDQDDLDPVRRCGIGVAVSNAVEAVRNAADVVTLSNDEDGVARFIEGHILNEEV